MLTPHFELSQDDEFVYVRIRLPHLRAEEGEFYVLDNEFKFFLKPYFLRLTFRNRLVEDGREHCEHDLSSGILTIRLPKETTGQTFDDLNMLSELLRKPDRTAARRPLIEVVGSEDGAAPMEGSDDDDFDELDPGDVEVDQQLPMGGLSLGSGAKYGFNGAHSGCFVGLDEDGELLLLRDAERSTAASRRAARLQDEEAAFDVDHYAADLMMPEECDAAIAYVPWWREALRTAEGGAAEGGAAEGGAAEGDAAAESGAGSWFGIGSDYQQQLQQLPRRELLLDKHERRVALCGLVDLIFGYCYDARTTDGEVGAAPS